MKIIKQRIYFQVKIDLLNPKTATIILFVFSAHWVLEIDQLKEEAIDQLYQMQKSRNNVRGAGM